MCVCLSWMMFTKTSNYEHIPLECWTGNVGVWVGQLKHCSPVGQLVSGRNFQKEEETGRKWRSKQNKTKLFNPQSRLLVNQSFAFHCRHLAFFLLFPPDRFQHFRIVRVNCFVRIENQIKTGLQDINITAIDWDNSNNWKSKSKLIYRIGFNYILLWFLQDTSHLFDTN